MTRIAIVDDHILFRDGFKSLLKDHSEFEIVFSAGDGREMIKYLNELPDEKRPEIILLDLEMPVMNGYESMLWLKQNHREIKIIVLSMHNDEAIILDMIKRGANGFLTKTMMFDEIINAINQVKNEGAYYDKRIANMMANNLQGDNATIPSFTDREMQILKLIATGSTTKEIAHTLDVSTRTVEFHRLNIYSKAKVKSLANLVMFALKNKLVSQADLFHAPEKR